MTTRVQIQNLGPGSCVVEEYDSFLGTHQRTLAPKEIAIIEVHPFRNIKIRDVYKDET